MNLQPPGGTRYDYPRTLSFIYFYAWLFIAVALSLTTLAVLAMARHVDARGTFNLLVSMSALLLSVRALSDIFSSARPIVISDTGIAALAFDKIWKTIPWKDVERIERIRRRSRVSGKIGFELLIIGPAEVIRIDYAINELQTLLEAINKFSCQYQIDVFSREEVGDTGTEKSHETNVTIKTVFTRKLRRKQLFETGVLKKMTSLL
ncbi:MAG: hypothetical protein ACYDC8_11425 [Gammaproteobacteria bacterium]